MGGNILFITSRNVFGSAGDATLILCRAKAIFSILGTESHILPINNTEYPVDIGLKGVKFIQRKENSILRTIEDYINKEKPTSIILSGDKAYLYLNFLKKTIKKKGYDCQIFLDLHGALEETLEYKEGTKLYRYLRYFVKKLLFQSTVKKSHGLFVVTDELAERYMENLSLRERERLKVIKIRCGIDTLLDNSQRIEWRDTIRKRWGIHKDTIVFVYSGHRMKWQKIDEIIEYYKRLDNKYENVFFAFFTQIDEDFQKTLEMSFPRKNYFAKMLSRNELMKYLCACDVGMLLRDNNYTNKVAFPNKFSEYINAGLVLAISESLREPIRLLKQYNIPFISLSVDNVKMDGLNLSIPKQRQENLTDFYYLCNSLSKQELLYEEQVKKEKNKFAPFINTINH